VVMIMKTASILFAMFAILVRSGQTADAPRAARSVHLGYPSPEGVLFYNEMVITQSVNGSYFMACGWNTGYFGLQQLSNETNKVAIFSVWDPTKGNDPKAVKTEERVENLFAGEGVRIKRFGGEGTGGQCMMPFAWQIGETNRFAVQAEVVEDKTSYTAWLFDPRARAWKRLATFRRPLFIRRGFPSRRPQRWRIASRPIRSRLDPNPRRPLDCLEASPFHRFKCEMGIEGKYQRRCRRGPLLFDNRRRHRPETGFKQFSRSASCLEGTASSISKITSQIGTPCLPFRPGFSKLHALFLWRM